MSAQGCRHSGNLCTTSVTHWLPWTLWDGIWTAAPPASTAGWTRARQVSHLPRKAKFKGTQANSRIKRNINVYFVIHFCGGFFNKNKCRKIYGGQSSNISNRMSSSGVRKHTRAWGTKKLSKADLLGQVTSFNWPKPGTGSHMASWQCAHAPHAGCPWQGQRWGGPFACSSLSVCVSTSSSLVPLSFW